MEYNEIVSEKINKVIADELTASIAYYRMAESLVGVETEEVSETLKEHGDEEFGHFKEILSFSYAHGIIPVIEVDTDKVNTSPTELKAVMKFTQELEKTAIADYKEISNLAKENNDMETMTFFSELMNDEIKHFDELSPFTGQKRGLNESLTVKSISEILEQLAKGK